MSVTLKFSFSAANSCFVSRISYMRFLNSTWNWYVFNLAQRKILYPNFNLATLVHFLFLFTRHYAIFYWFETHPIDSMVTFEIWQFSQTSAVSTRSYWSNSFWYTRCSRSKSGGEDELALTGCAIVSKGNNIVMINPIDNHFSFNPRPFITQPPFDWVVWHTHRSTRRHMSSYQIRRHL